MKKTVITSIAMLALASGSAFASGTVIPSKAGSYMELAQVQPAGQQHAISGAAIHNASAVTSHPSHIWDDRNYTP